MGSSVIAVAVLTGLSTGLGLIVAIGAQNAFVLRQGIRREHIVPVVVICALSDIALIAAGVGGLGTLVTSAPLVLQVARWAGAAALTVYAVMAMRRALRPSALVAAGGGDDTGRRRAVLTALAITWLNPHVYLDTVLLLGSVASSHGDQRWWFAIGAMIGSIVWFCTIGFGARLLRGVFARPGAWRVLDLVIAAIMLAMAAMLVLGA
ncbi:LysE family transporter [Epidermidibacterium keratini]|uniref:LysE family transporter n=1 Tax=Epidermidibacterium keratini TaxID=1891644 RepID=A0A7L4YP90_9ACTN|nr:LysE/ArgO family amino acid transporter [Epidermidibacterium keratini]QHC01101.1 LysE family transporter [Epidermidibacterium keratini]